MNLGDILGLLVLVVGVPLNLYVVRRMAGLWMPARARWVLRERARTAAIVFVTVTVFGMIFANNDLEQPIIPVDATRIITRAVMLLLALGPAIYWLWLYRRA